MSIRFLPLPRYILLHSTDLSSPSPHPHLSPHSLSLPLSIKPQLPTFVSKAKINRRVKPIAEPQEVEAELVAEEAVEGGEGEEFSSSNGFRGKEDEKDFEGEAGEFSYPNAFRGREDERDYDRDPEFAEILGSCFDDPQKAQSKVEERIRRKRSKILHAKTGSATPIKVKFNKFDFSNSYIWFEFYNAPLPKDISLICDTIRSWHIIGRLGGCNSMNMQLSQSPLDNKRPNYDAIQGANVTPTTFYNIGDLEIQDNLGRIWVDIGTSEPLLLDVLINALTCISSELLGYLPLDRMHSPKVGTSDYVIWLAPNSLIQNGSTSTHLVWPEVPTVRGLD